jgi:hypothetical protein
MAFKRKETDHFKQADYHLSKMSDKRLSTKTYYQHKAKALYHLNCITADVQKLQGRKDIPTRKQIYDKSQKDALSTIHKDIFL